MFRFEEQNQLHEEIISTPGSRRSVAYFEVGERMQASEDGVAIKKTLLDGKPFQKILDHARKTNPWLIVVGRMFAAYHSPKDETGMGSRSGEHSPRCALRCPALHVLESPGSTYAPRRPSDGRPKQRSG